jgi:hypothetical protein
VRLEYKLFDLPVFSDVQYTGSLFMLDHLFWYAQYLDMICCGGIKSLIADLYIEVGLYLSFLCLFLNLIHILIVYFYFLTSHR